MCYKKYKKYEYVQKRKYDNIIQLLMCDNKKKKKSLARMIYIFLKKNEIKMCVVCVKNYTNLEMKFIL